MAVIEAHIRKTQPKKGPPVRSHKKLEESREVVVKRKLEETIRTTTEQHRIYTCSGGWVRCLDCPGRAKPTNQKYWMERPCTKLQKKQKRVTTDEEYKLTHYTLSEPLESYCIASDDELDDGNQDVPEDHHSTPRHFELIKELLELEVAGETVLWPEGLSKRIAENQLACIEAATANDNCRLPVLVTEIMAGNTEVALLSVPPASATRDFEPEENKDEPEEPQDLKACEECMTTSDLTTVFWCSHCLKHLCVICGSYGLDDHQCTHCLNSFCLGCRSDHSEGCIALLSVPPASATPNVEPDLEPSVHASVPGSVHEAGSENASVPALVHVSVPGSNTTEQKHDTSVHASVPGSVRSPTPSLSPPILPDRPPHLCSF